MGKLPQSIKESLKKDIKNCEFLGFKDAAQLHQKDPFSNGIYRNQNKEMLLSDINYGILKRISLHPSKKIILTLRPIKRNT